MVTLDVVTTETSAPTTLRKVRMEQVLVTTLNNHTGVAEFYITYDDTDNLVTNLRVNNGCDRTARLSFYAPADPVTPFFVYDAAPGVDKSQNIPKSRGYNVEEWSYSFRVL